MEGVKSGSRTVLEAKNVSFHYTKGKDYLVNQVSVKLSLNSRVAICGRNGCGKSTLMTLLCSEMSPSEGKGGEYGEVSRHCNLRSAHMKQDHLKTLTPFFDTSPFVYITDRFKHGSPVGAPRHLLPRAAGRGRAFALWVAGLHGMHFAEDAVFEDGAGRFNAASWVDGGALTTYWMLH